MSVPSLHRESTDSLTPIKKDGEIGVLANLFMSL